MAEDDLTTNSHTRKDEAKLAVTVSRLVEVHEVHVDSVPRNLEVMLSGELQQWLLEFLEATNPHLCWGEGVHPGDDAEHVLVSRGFDHEALDGVGILQGWLQRDLDWQVVAFVQRIDNVSGLLSNLTQGFFAIQVLRADGKPNFLAFEWIDVHCCPFMVNVVFTQTCFFSAGYAPSLWLTGSRQYAPQVSATYFSAGRKRWYSGR